MVNDATRQAVINAIIASKVSGPAKLEAARLCEKWLDEAGKWPDTAEKSIGVECLWYIQLEKKTWAVGVIDRITETLFCEWKTRRAPKVKLNGEPYKGDTEGDWLTEISEGPQLAVYALAGRHGHFDIGSSEIIEHVWWTPNVAVPQLLVRCAVKSTPALIWGGNVFSFPPEVLEATWNALVVKAHAIRAARAAGLRPWQLMGYHCRTYNRDCKHLPLCRSHQHPPLEPVGWQHSEDSAPDPGYGVAALLNLDVHDPELVVLSQSAYQTYSRCMEKGRIDYGGHVKGETSYELEVGSAAHVGWAAFYREL